MMVITARDIARDTARTLPEVLAHLGGLYVRNNSGSPDRQLDLRGFGITGDQNTLVLLDGVRLNSPFFGGYDWSLPLAAGVGRVEVVRGPYSALYGADAIGGVVQMFPAAVAGTLALIGVSLATRGEKPTFAEVAENMAHERNAVEGEPHDQVLHPEAPTQPLEVHRK